MPKYQLWLSTLPTLLCKTKITEGVIIKLSYLSKLNNFMFHKSLLKHMPAILGWFSWKIVKFVSKTIFLSSFAGNVLNIEIVRESDVDESLLRLTILSLFSFTPKYKIHIKLLKDFMETHKNTIYYNFIDSNYANTDESV